MDRGMEWANVATAPDQLTAEMWVQILKDAGIPAMIRPTDAVSFLGVSGYGCRVQVPKDEVRRALQVLEEVELEPDERDDY
jgi:hypothetical protein